MSSRIFIKGLPPTITTEEFREHFSKIATVTDAKLISHRRIGYIGYPTQEDAAKSVKYFNRTFIRMSRISVEIARPIDDVLRKTDLGYGQIRSESIDSEKKPSVISSSNQSLKRKRNESDESRHKLTEFLDVMQPASKNKISAIQKPPFDSDLQTKALDDVSPCIEKGNEEHEKTVQNPRINEPEINTPKKPKLAITSELSNNVSKTRTLNLTDDEWVRDRTNRLLELQSLGETEQTAAKIEYENGLESNQIDIAKVPTQNEDCLHESSISQATEENGIDPSVELIKKNQRLFVRNLSYTITEEDLESHFSSFGILKEVHLPVDVSGKSKGFAHIQFVESSAAIKAYNDLDGKPLQGRLLHIIPGYAKREEKFDDLALSNLSFTKQKQIKKKIQAASANFSWNSLYLDQDAVNSAIATRLGVTKAEIIDPTSTDSAWKQALAETSIIQESQAYFKAKGVDLNSFKRRERGDKAILVKNLPFGTTSEDLRTMFEEFGKIIRVLVPPSGTIAIVEFAQPGHAKAAFAGLCYRRVKDLVLFLEKAPKDLFINADEVTDVVLPDNKLSLRKEDQKIVSVSDLLEQENPADYTDNSTLYVRNLNFSTTSERLVQVFKSLSGFLSARVSTKKDTKRPGQILSMGFGFLEFKTKEEALSALKAMDGYSLDGHSLVVKMSHKGLDAAEERRKEDIRKKDSAKRTKIIIKNLPFEATKKDIRILFSAFGKLRSVRLPKKFDQSIRGFAFADFINSREAENALEALKNTHLLGRRLILEFAAAEALDAEEEIERMQKKVSSQVNKVALQKLTGGGRKKFDMENNENDN
ncbi:Multiple RNA-binding domain-containing protein 1 [Erysiphe neolycopersici]|uniref:Multiple RNA-binding domain-containing protein 1 n=1 Tax=Erysiphe neolycopersici TaxID=212602 RepID=A0A420HXR2_9PEZI|nr:Multiple RNA-binding domain-containing protein 1 [Erysiphe neolycopersici]